MRDAPKTLRLPALWMAASLLGACAGEPPNLILISMDTLRADRLSAYGELERRTTPTLDRLAHESALFGDCTAASTVTGPSHLSLFTGQYPQRHGLTGNGERVQPRYTLASVLAGAGFETAGFTGGGYLRERFGLAHGFETYRARGGPRAAFKRTFATSLPHATEWLDERGEGPFFLFLHGYDPHCPYEASERDLRRFSRVTPAPFDPSDRCGEQDYLPLLAAGRFGASEVTHLEDLYDALVSSADRALAAFVRRLDEEGLLETSILVFTSDHGESLGEHGWIGHGRLWEEQARVPLFIRFPERHFGDDRFVGRVDAPVSLVDLFPTLLDALDVDLPANLRAGLQGRSLLPLLRGSANPSEIQRLVAFEDEETVRFGSRWKIGFRRVEGGVVERHLWDLAADPGELDDLVASNEGRARFDELFARHEAGRKPEVDRRARIVVRDDDGLTAEEREELSALGYAQE